MPLVGTRANASARAYGFTSAGAPEVLGGMVLITPTSIVSTGTGNSSSIGANGSVTFTSCETVSLNGVFTSTYDNYFVVYECGPPSGATTLYWRLRSSGTDSTATTDYNAQLLTAESTTVSGERRTADGLMSLGALGTTYRTGVTATIYGPFLSQPTASRSVNAGSVSNASIADVAGTHELSTSYDGITFVCGVVLSGKVSVYGLVGA
jgi:hypothetical protein